MPCDTHTDMSPFIVDVVVGQLRCAGHVQPAQATIDTQATLVEMDDRSSEECWRICSRLVCVWLGKLAGGGENGRLRGRMTVERSQQLSDARQGDELLAVQVAGERFRRGPYCVVASRGREILPARTHHSQDTASLHLMLRHFDAGRWYVEHLPLQHAPVQRHPAALSGSAGNPPAHARRLLRLRHLQQVRPLCPRCPPRGRWPDLRRLLRLLFFRHRCRAACRYCDCLSHSWSCNCWINSCWAAICSCSQPPADATHRSTQGSLDIAALDAHGLVLCIHSYHLLYIQPRDMA